MKRLNKGLFAILLTMSMVSTTAVFAEEATPTPTPTPTASIEVMEGVEETSTPTEETVSSLSIQATAFISNVNEAETNRDNILNAAQEYVDAYVASFDAEGEEATAAADALIVEKEDAFFNLFDQGELLDAYDALADEEKENEEVINAKALLDALIADVDTIMNMEEPADEPTTFSAGVTVNTGSPTTIDMSLVTSGVVEIKSDGLWVNGIKEPGETTVNPDGYEFTGTTTSSAIKVSVDATIILNNLSITNNNIAVNNGNCIDVSHINSEIILQGTNILECGVGAPSGGWVQCGAALRKGGMDGSMVIDGTGSLNAKGTVQHAGAISDSFHPANINDIGFANVTIKGGTIVAVAGAHSPAIGAQCQDWLMSNETAYAKNITLTGTSNITAYGGKDCAGIGAGAGTPVEGITISGAAQVKAYGGLNSPGIGSGGTDVSFTDTVVNPYGSGHVNRLINFHVTDIEISGGGTHVWAYGDQATNMPGIGCGKDVNGRWSSTRVINNVVASPNVPDWATYIKYGTSATDFAYTTTADNNGAGESLATPISSDREFATFLQAKANDGANVYYTEVYFSLPHDEFASTDKADIGANNYSTCAGSFTWADTTAAKTQLLSLAKVSGHDQNGVVLSESDILANIATNATAQATFDNQIQTIFDANANNATGNYLLTFEFNYVDNNDHTNKTMKVSTHIQFRDACSPTISGSAPVIAASNAVHPTGGVAWTKAELIGLTEGTASNYLGLDADLVNDITLTQADVDAINAAKTANQTGIFPLTYTYVTTTDGTTPVTLTKKVYVTLTDTGTPFTPKDPNHPEKGQNMGPQIGANDYITKTGGAAFDTTTLKKIQNVSAKDSNGTSIPLDKLIPDPTQLAAINAAKTSGQVGDFPLKYTFEDVDGTIREVETTVKLRDNEGTTPTPVEKKDDNNKVIGYVISTPELGSNNHTTPTGGTGWTADEIKTLLDVVGKDSHGATIARTDFTVDPADLNLLNTHKQQGLCGRYPVKFTGPNGETVTSYVTLTGCPVPTPKPIPGPFLVTYLDCYGNTVKVEWVNYGGSSTKPNNNYPDIVNVSENKEVRPNNCAYNVPNTGV